MEDQLKYDDIYDILQLIKPLLSPREYKEVQETANKMYEAKVGRYKTLAMTYVLDWLSARLKR